MADIEITTAQLQAAGDWMRGHIASFTGAARLGTEGVRLTVDDRMLLLEKDDGGRMAWDLGGEPASQVYLDEAPLDPMVVTRRPVRPRATIEQEDGTRVLRCARAGCDSADFRYIEEAETMRNVEGVDSDGRLAIHAYYEVGDEGSDGFLFCQVCQAEQDLPEGVEIDWT